MRLNFPKQEEAVLVHIKLKPTMFEATKDIAELIVTNYNGTTLPLDELR